MLKNTVKILSNENLIELLNEVNGELAVRLLPKQKAPDAVAAAPLSRKQAIELAKKDLETLKDSSNYYVGTDKDKYACKAEFIVNKKKRTVVVLLKGWLTGKVRYKGKATAEPGDCFNVHIGKSIALHRALGLPVPERLTHIPNPTVAERGDLVEGILAGGKATLIAIDANTDKFKLNETAQLGSFFIKDGKVVDDSKETEIELIAKY